jgi:arabinofuranan 3-O-arabinosyltransferase
VSEEARRPRLVARGEIALVAVLCHVPLLIGARGRLNADTKQYLYLDPAGLMHRALSLWDTNVAGGAVSHQQVGYLWPMGPFFWLGDLAHLPDWVTQRLWIGSIQAHAVLGALVLFRTVLPRHGPAQLIAALGYGLSPFVLGHITGQSALVLPFTAFGWMVWTLVRGLDEGTWRWPAGFALLVTSCGSLNGTSVFFVLVGAVLWVPFGVWILGRASGRDGVRLLVRAGALTLVTQLWWLVAYLIGGRYGLPILSITETVQATSSTTSAAEVLRGLGYWFFYGRDAHQAWLPGLATSYMTSPALLMASFAVPVIALGLASRLRWSSRAYFAALVTLGTLIATVSFSAPRRSPAGVVFEAASRRIDLVLSLRNTQRAGPLIALGVMGLLAAALTALWGLHVRRALAAGGLLLVAVLGSMPAEVTNGLIAERFHRTDVPAYWEQAGRLLDRGEGNVLELPGIDFAAYRWGNTLDPVSVGLTDRPVLARELVPQGSPIGVSLLNAVDLSLQEGWVEPRALAPMARLLGASTVLARNDLEYERYRTARPLTVWDALTDPSSGLGRPQGVGAPTVNRAAPDRPMVDETQLAQAGQSAELPPVALFVVPGGDRAPLSPPGAGATPVVAGSGEGLYGAAAAGLLDSVPGALVYGADLALPGSDRALVGPSPRYLVTDSNRDQDELWYSLHQNLGATEPAGDDVSDHESVGGAIDIVEGEPESARTVVRWDGAKRIWATDYGNSATLVPEDRPSNAFDGDPNTAWRVDTASIGAPYVLSIELEHPVDPDHVTLVQPQARPGTRPVTKATIVQDGTRRFPVEIRPSAAFDPKGARVALDGKPFHRLDVELDGVDLPFGAAGFGEVEIPGVHARELVVPPTSTLAGLGAAAGRDPIAFVLDRLRADPAEPLRADPESRLLRVLDLPAAMSLHLSGTVRLRPAAPDDRIDRRVSSTGPATYARQHLPGDLASRASAALDGDPATAWTTPFVGLTGQWWESRSTKALHVDRISLDVVADDHHSLPTQVAVSTDGGAAQLIDLPALERGGLGTVRRVTLPLPEELDGTTVRVTVTKVARRTTTDWYGDGQIALPVAFAEIGIPGLRKVTTGAKVDTGCRDDLVTLDGAPIPVRVTGSSAAALDRDGLAIATCDGKPLPVAAGRHVLETTAGYTNGLDLDRLVLRTAAWDASTTAPDPGPAVRVTSDRRGHVSGEADSDGSPFWLVVDQSPSAGWKLTARGAEGSVAVDGPHPIDGNAVGWLVRPTKAGALAVTASWTPQRSADVALRLSFLGALVCLGLLVFPRRRPHHGEPYGPPRLTRGPDIAWHRTLPWAAATAAVAAICISPLLALPTGFAMAVFGARPRWGRYIPPGFVLVATLSILLGQLRDRVPAGPGWPAHYSLAHVLTLMAVVLLGMEALGEAARHRKARLRREARDHERLAHPAPAEVPPRRTTAQERLAAKQAARRAPAKRAAKQAGRGDPPGAGPRTREPPR